VTELKCELGDLRTANDKLNRAVVTADRTRRILRLSSHGRLLLERYFGKIKGAMLPTQLITWTLQADTALRRATDLPTPRGAKVIERSGRRLIVRIVSEPGRYLVVLEEQITEMDASMLKTLGLTQRQAEVLKYIALGKSNPEIGIILGLSPRTAGKHVEEILRRLHVSTRTEAASIALDATILRWS
jgi:DNA-binding CsgD family transcriptional regulator